MQFTYQKIEKLKSKTSIDFLFSEGNLVPKFPLRLVYVENKEANAPLLKIGVSVSKKYFNLLIKVQVHLKSFYLNFSINKKWHVFF